MLRLILLRKNLSYMKINECPTCTAPLNSDFHLDIKKEKQDSLDLLFTEWNQIKDDAEKAETELTDLRQKGRTDTCKGWSIRNTDGSH